jgi:cytochrome c-type biogenesis protein
MPEVNLILAFAAGVLGFISPCIVPLIPGYVSFVSGLSLSEMDPHQRRQHLGRVWLSTLLFVLGFSTIFTAMGASATVAGNFILSNRQWLSRAGGVVVIVLGLAVLGVLKIPSLYRERRFQVRARGIWGAFPIGMAFGFAWTPCVGPILAAILTLAATAGRASDGALLLFAYSIGLGVPFLVAAGLLSTVFDALSGIRRHGRAIEAISGAFLVVMGAALMFDLVFKLNTWILRLIPFQPAI